MELDREIKQSMIESSKKYLKDKSVPYRFITIRGGLPVVILDIKDFYSVIDRNLDGDCIEGRFLSQGENGWNAYIKEGAQSKYNLMEGMTEYQASCYITGAEFGRKPKTTRYAMGVLS